MGVPLNLWSAKLGCLKLPQGSVQIVWVKGNRARDCRCSMSRFHLACFEKPSASWVFYECPLLRMFLQGSGACKEVVAITTLIWTLRTNLNIMTVVGTSMSHSHACSIGVLAICSLDLAFGAV